MSAPYASPAATEPGSQSGQRRRPPAEATVLALILVIASTALVSALSGMISAGGDDPWYQALNRAPGNPPDFVFGLVWPALYVLMAIGAGLVWRAAGWPAAKAALGIYGLQLAANFAWSYLFFGLHQPLASLIDIIVMWVLIALMIREFGKHSPLAARLQYPYLAWVTFATYLNGWIVVAN